MQIWTWWKCDLPKLNEHYAYISYKSYEHVMTVFPFEKQTFFYTTATYVADFVINNKFKLTCTWAYVLEINLEIVIAIEIRCESR